MHYHHNPYGPPADASHYNPPRHYPPPLQHAAAAAAAAAFHPPDDMDHQALEAAEKYKTELCRKFSLTGFCRYADMCQFAHGAHELRPLIRHPLYKTSMCKSFVSTGSCRYGARCRFIHNETLEELNNIPRGVASVNLVVSEPSWEEIKEASEDMAHMVSARLAQQQALPATAIAATTTTARSPSPPLSRPSSADSILYAPTDLDARRLPVARTTIGLSTMQGSSSTSLASAVLPGTMRQSSSLPLLSIPADWRPPSALPRTSPVASPSQQPQRVVTFDVPPLPRASTVGASLDKSGAQRLSIFRNISDQDLARLDNPKPRLPSFETLHSHHIKPAVVGLNLSDTEGEEELHGLNF